MMDEPLWGIGAEWIMFKGRLADDLQLSHDALHIHFSLAIMFIVGRIIGRRPDTIVPFLWVLFLAIANEANDMASSLTPYSEHSMASSVKDLLNTMFWPIVLLCFGRSIFPASFNRAAVVNPEGAAPLDDCNRDTQNLHPDNPVPEQKSNI